MPQSFYIIGQGGNPAGLDTGTKGGKDCGFIVEISEEHHKLHLGVTYESGGSIDTIDTGEHVNWFIRTPIETIIHFLFSFESSQAGEINVYRDPVVTAVGNACNIVNCNENSIRVPELLIYKNTIVSSPGNQFFGVVVGSDAPPAMSSGGAFFRKQERVLKKNTDYLICFTSKYANNRISHLFSFVEE